MLERIAGSAGIWALWKGLDWAYSRYFARYFGTGDALHPELARSTRGLSEAHMAALKELGRQGSPLRIAVEEILEQEYHSFAAATEDLSKRIDSLPRPEAEVLIALMLLGRSAQQQ